MTASNWSERRRAYQNKWRAEHREQINEQARQWYAANKERERAYQRERRRGQRILYPNQQAEQRRQIRAEVLAHYGGKCTRCGFDDYRALQLDHINNDGYLHRKQGRPTGSGFFRWVKRNGFPADLQVLCANCNWIKRYETDPLLPSP